MAEITVMDIATSDLLTILFALTALIANVFLAAKLRTLKQQIISNHTKTLSILDTVRSQKSLKTSIKNKQALVEKTVSGGTEAVENIHQTISDAAFNVIHNLSSTQKIKARSQKLRDLHDQTTSDVYKSVKEVNKQVGVFTNALLSNRKPTSTPAEQNAAEADNSSSKHN